MSTTMTIKNISGKAGFFGYGDPSFYLEAGASQANLPYSLAASDQFEKDLESGIIEVTAGSPLLNFKNASAIRRYFGYGPGGQVLAHDGTLDSQVPVDSGLPGVQGIADNPYFIADLSNEVIGDAATITVAAMTNGTVSPAAGVHAVQMGDDVMVILTPSANYRLATLTVDSHAVAALTNPYHFEKIAANHTLAATFSLNTYTVTFVPGVGTRTGGGALVQTINYNAAATAPTLTAPSHKRFKAWNHAFTNVTANLTVTASYDDVWYLAYTAAAHGTLTGTASQTVIDGEAGTAVTAVPGSGYHFTKWSDDSTDNPRQDTVVGEDISVSAAFAINTYTMTYTAGAHGSIVGTSPQTVNWGVNAGLVTATPAAHYHFASWSDAYPTAERQDMGVIANVTAAANFAVDTYVLTYNAGTHGSVTGTSPQTVAYGASGSEVIAVAADGYVFEKWSDDVMTAARTDSNVTANATVTATFVSA